MKTFYAFICTLIFLFSVPITHAETTINAPAFDSTEHKPYKKPLTHPTNGMTMDVLYIYVPSGLGYNLWDIWKLNSDITEVSFADQMQISWSIDNHLFMKKDASDPFLYMKADTWWRIALNDWHEPVAKKATLNISNSNSAANVNVGGDSMQNTSIAADVNGGGDSTMNTSINDVLDVQPVLDDLPVVASTIDGNSAIEEANISESYLQTITALESTVVALTAAVETLQTAYANATQQTANATEAQVSRLQHENLQLKLLLIGAACFIILLLVALLLTTLFHQPRLKKSLSKAKEEKRKAEEKLAERDLEAKRIIDSLERQLVGVSETLHSTKAEVSETITMHHEDLDREALKELDLRCGQTIAYVLPTEFSKSFGKHVFFLTVAVNPTDSDDVYVETQYIGQSFALYNIKKMLSNNMRRIQADLGIVEDSPLIKVVSN